MDFHEISGPPEGGDARIELAPGVHVARSDLTFTFVRGSGPGGQAVNKLSSAARLRVPIAAIEGLTTPARDRLRALAGRRRSSDDAIHLRSRAHRSQLDNRRACIERLRELVRHAVTPPRPRKKTRPSRGSIERRLEAKRRQSDRKRRRRPPEE
jgi:ribosome-associated protein